MANTQAPASATLTPLTVYYEGQRVDLSLPAGVPVAELLPGMVSALGRLTTEAATQGFRVLTPAGAELAQDRTLADQDVRPGVGLTLELCGTAASDLRYDDLVEAIGVAVDGSRTPWRRGDSVQLSAFAAVGLFLVAAALLSLRGAGSPTAAAVAITGALLVTLAATVIRTETPHGALGLALTAPVLGAAAGYCLLPGPAQLLPAVLAGFGALLGSGACLVLPRPQRAAVAGPLAAGLALTLFGALGWLAAVPLRPAAALVVALLTLIVLLSPWLGLAQMPVRIAALAPGERGPVEPATVLAEMGEADVSVLSVRVWAAVIVLALTPLVATNPAGAALMACVGAAMILGTRTMYGRAEVLAGVISGLLIVVATGLTLTYTLPEALPWVAGVTMLLGAFVLANNVVSVKLRPALTRAADGVQVLVLMALLPLTALVWGIA